MGYVYHDKKEEEIFNRNMIEIAASKDKTMNQKHDDIRAVNINEEQLDKFAKDLQKDPRITKKVKEVGNHFMAFMKSSFELMTMVMKRAKKFEKMQDKKIIDIEPPKLSDGPIRRHVD